MQKKIFEETNNYVSKIDSRYESRFNENVEIFRGTGSFLSNNIVKVNDDELTAPKIVIATGTKPIKAGHEKAWTSDDIFPLKGKIPKSITIVGSGFIACELANFFQQLELKQNSYQEVKEFQEMKIKIYQQFLKKSLQKVLILNLIQQFKMQNIKIINLKQPQKVNQKA